jgi:hypothetical protein
MHSRFSLSFPSIFPSIHAEEKKILRLQANKKRNSNKGE